MRQAKLITFFWLTQLEYMRPFRREPQALAMMSVCHSP